VSFVYIATPDVDYAEWAIYIELNKSLLSPEQDGTVNI
jgi:hypothetical protein